MTSLLHNIVQTRCGGAVERCHVVRHQGSYSNAMHQWGVAMLLYFLYPADFPRLAANALFHDVGEAWFGDIPAPTVRYVPGIKTILGKLEGDACEAYGLPREDALSPEDHAKIKNCDRLELMLWCGEQILAGNLFMTEVYNEVTRYLEAADMDADAKQLYTDIRRAVVTKELLPRQPTATEEFVKAKEQPKPAPAADSTFTRIKTILVEHLNQDEDKVVGAAKLIEDLGADSLDLVELVMAAEEEFGIEISDDDAEKLLTVQDAVDYIKRKLED